jgi:uncharacterized membrane protein YcfT
MAGTPQADDHSATPAQSGGNRFAWVDTAKGICIILVVMMHAVAGYQIAVDATGWMQPVLDFTKPFRMPDFFVLSALFVYARIDAPWKVYVDRKVLHFAYFYILWMVIQIGVKQAMDGAAPADILGQMALALVQPFGTLWFIYLLAIFLIATRLLRPLPVLPVWIAAAALQIAPVSTGVYVIDYFASYFVFFYTGHILSAHLFSMADAARRNLLSSWGLIAVWAALNGAAVWSGVAGLPGVALMLGLAGAAAIVAFAAVIAGTWAGRALAIPGAHSIAIYLAFFLPMAASRIILAKTGLIPDVGLASFIVMACAVLTPLILYYVVRHTPLKFLFERPNWARIIPPGSSKKSATAPLVGALATGGR